MESSQRNVISFSILALLLGWGSLWSGSIALSLNSNAENNPAANSAEVIRTLTATPASTPSPAPTTTVSPVSSLTIMMGGDVMLDRRIRLLGSVNGYDSLFSSIAPLFSTADIATVNLEGPITSYASRTLNANDKTTSEMSFTFDPDTAPILANAHITAVSLANNHADNFGRDGYEQTKEWLQKSNVGYFGNSWNDSGTELVITKNDIRVAFLGYHAFLSGFPRIVADVKRLKAAGDLVIVMPHWGVEYSTQSTADMHEKAHELVAAGADAVIGAHPHVIEDHEWIGKVPVFYSLGNLVFDQYFEANVMKGNIVALHIQKNDQGVHVASVDVYETSTASHTTVAVSDQPTYSEFAPQ